MAAPIRRCVRAAESVRCSLLRCSRRHINHGTIAKTLKKDVGSEVTVKGWVKAVRRHKDVCFVHVTDGLSAGHIQIVVSPDGLPAAVNNGASIVVSGTLVKSMRSEQPMELKTDRVSLISDCPSEEFPFLPRTIHPPDYVRKYLHLRPKTNAFSALLRIRSEAMAAVHKYFKDLSYVNISTPILTATDCEGGGETFVVRQNATKDVQEPFFKHPVFLTVSGQLHLEVASGALSRVYTLGPAFRADNSIDRTHLSEFYMVEAEFAFSESLEDLLEVMEDCVKTVSRTLLGSPVADDIAFFHKATPGTEETLRRMLNTASFERITYSDALALLAENQDKFSVAPVKWGSDLHREHERFLVKAAGDLPVFVTDFPSALKPFYMRQNDGDNGRTMACTDLLVPGPGELCGGSLREERLDYLKSALNSRRMTGDYAWYLDLRRFGSVPHCGFGMGFERFLQYFLGIAQIRDTIPFPRYAGNCRM